MPLFNYDTNESSPKAKKRIKRVIAHEKGEYSRGDYDKYIVPNYPGGTDELLDLKRNDYNKYQSTVDSLYTNAIPGGVPKIFESDAQRTVEGDINDLYDDVVIDLSTEGAEAKLREELSGAGELVLYGHSSMGSYNAQGEMIVSPRYGGIPLDSIANDIGEDCNVFLGACNSQYAGQAAANALGRDVNAQIGTASWTGAQKGLTTMDAFTRPVEGTFKKGEKRSQVYSPQ